MTDLPDLWSLYKLGVESHQLEANLSYQNFEVAILIIWLIYNQHMDI